MPDLVTITRKEYEQLLGDFKFLEALRAAGVDNWDGYGFALEALQEEEEGLTPEEIASRGTK